MSSFDTIETAQAEGWFDITPKQNLQVALLGDSGVGKTTYLTRIKKGKFEICESTKFLSSKKVTLFEGKPEIEVHDFSGKIMECVTRPSEYLKDVNAVFIFFETGNETSRTNAVFKWFKFAKECIGCQIPIIFIGTKNDSNLQISSNIKICGVYYPTYFISSKTGKRVEMPFLSYMNK